MTRGRKTVALVEEREDYVFEMLSRGLHKSVIKKSFRARFDEDGLPTPARTIENYIARARERVLLVLSRTREEERAQSVAFYEAMARDETATVGELIRARERIDKLLGLEAASKHEHVGKDGGVLETKTTLILDFSGKAGSGGNGADDNN